jgi:hypothetical protein
MARQTTVDNKYNVSVRKQEEASHQIRKTHHSDANGKWAPDCDLHDHLVEMFDGTR